MASINQDKIIEAYNNITNLIVEITTDPKPNYDIDGQKISWGDYLEQLTTAQGHLRKQIDTNIEPWELEQQII